MVSSVAGLPLVMSKIEELILDFLANYQKEHHEAAVDEQSLEHKDEALTKETLEKLTALVPLVPLVPGPHTASPKCRPSCSDLNISEVSSKASSFTKRSSQKFELHVGWRDLGAGSQRNSRRTAQSTIPLSMVQSQPIKRGKLWQRCWHFLAMLLILYDTFSIPLEVAFVRSSVWIMDLIAIFFWTTNLFMRLRPNLKALLRGLWNLMLLVFLLQSRWEDSNSAWKLLQLLRLPELPELYGASCAVAVQNWLRHKSRETKAICNAFVTVMGLLCSLHVLTCLWFGVGRLPGGWVTQEITSIPFREQYRMTLEWSLSRLPPSRTTENLLLDTQVERALALLATALGMLCGAIFTSIVTNDISDIRRIKRLHSEAECQLTDFLMAYPVSHDLEKQLQDYLQRNRSSSASQPPCKREMSVVLPSFLFRELCREALSPIVKKHGLFNCLSSFTAFQYDFCARCLVDWNVAPHEILFNTGQKCQSMLFIGRGQVFYETGALSACDAFLGSAGSAGAVLPEEALLRQELSEASGRNWLCEACLWTPWHYMGKAQAGSGTTLLCLQQEEFLNLTFVHTEATNEIMEYAKRFLYDLNALEDVELTDLPIGGAAARKSGSMTTIF